jgi:SAM-dependent methyltransferase
MAELWTRAKVRSAEWDMAALDYDRSRPRYPDALFDDLMDLAQLGPGSRVVEIGAGTGIATVPLVDRGYQVSAVEAQMAAIAQSKLEDRAQVLIETFEDVPLQPLADLVIAFISWHWVDPAIGVPRLASLLAPGRPVALVWTDVISWGQEPFEQLVADRLGFSWLHGFDQLTASKAALLRDGRFGPFLERRYRFERRLDAETYLAVMRTYGGEPTAEREEVVEEIINGSCGGIVTKTEDAVVYLSRRRWSEPVSAELMRQHFSRRGK